MQTKWSARQRSLTVALVTKTDVLASEGEYRRLLGQAIVELRRAAGMSQAELADAVERSEAAVSRWETGKATPSAFDVRRIAQASGLDEGDVDLLIFPPETPVESGPRPARGAVDQDRPIRRLPSRGLGGARNAQRALDEGPDATR
jgi:transcriptional regulator with XRE-family HTH domain